MCFQYIPVVSQQRSYITQTAVSSLSPLHFSSAVSSSLPSHTHFSALDVNAATDTLLSTSSLDNICALSSRPAHAAPSYSWLSDVLREHRSEFRAAERKWRKSKYLSDLSIYQSLLSSFSAEVHTAKASYLHNKVIQLSPLKFFYNYPIKFSQKSWCNFQ